MRVLVWLFWGGVGLASLLVGSVMFSMVSASMAPPKRETAQEILNLPASNLSTGGRIADAFGFISDQTRIQRDALEKEIVGQIIEWTLPVYEIQHNDRRLLVQTGSAKGQVDIDCVVPNPSAEDVSRALQLRTGDLVTCKGRIKGARLITGLEISPAAILWR